MNLAVAARLRFIDFLIDHVGYFQRAMLMDYFGLSLPQASLDFKLYHEQNPANCIYNPSTKRWERAAGFVRRYP